MAHPGRSPRLTFLSVAILLAAGTNCIARGWWATEPLVRPVVPTIASGWPQSPVDAFVAARHQQLQLQPTARATRQTLIRRAYFDVTGLPPSPGQIDRFVNDPRPSAFAHLIDELLASPRYGERWARHWMDLVHFAETHGHDEDAIRENAWPYRDYLVRSFNSDKPYGRFVEEQVAGDVLFGDPWAIVATGFLAAGPWDASSQMGIQDGTIDKKIAQYLDRDDMLTTTMSTFTSLTVHCARCHDHKFDAISQQDYYSLQAVFAGIDRADRPYDPANQQRRLDLLAEKQALGEGDVSKSHFDAAQLAEWEQGLAGPRWSVVEPESVDSTYGSRFEKLGDGSVLFSGDRPDRDTYTIRGGSPLTRVTAVRLEVLTDPILPMGGPGREDNGNFHLSEFEVGIGDGKTVKVERAEADFNQDGWPIDGTLDGDVATAWAVFPEVGRSHRAMFILEEPLTCQPDTTLRFRLDQLQGGGRLIGRLRISVTDEPAPSPGLIPPASINAILENACQQTFR